MFSDFYKNKKVFLTGHTGFKGSWLALWLSELGAEVKGYALEPNTERDHYIVSNIGSRVESVIGDIRDYEKLNKEIKTFNPDVIFHMAAQPLVRYSYANPIENYETNVMGTVNIFEIASKLPNLISILNVTTDKCYENVEQERGYKESDHLGGHDPYSSSKACSEIVTSSMRRSFFESKSDNQTLVTTARAGNVIGGGDWCEDRIIADCFRSLSQNKPIEVRNPSAVRPWQHVLEPLSGYLHLASLRNENDWKRFAGPWNFGPIVDKLVTVGELVDMVITSLGKGSWEDRSNSDSPHEAKLLHLDIEKALERIGWRPNLSVIESVDFTTKWYQAFLESKDPLAEMSSFSIEQLNQYISKARKNNLTWADSTP